MTAIVSAILVLAMLPSFTALSEHLYSAFPLLGKYFGPLNVVKLFCPLLFVFIWNERKRVPRTLWLWIAASVVLLELGTFTSLLPCGFIPGVLRENAVILIGCVAAFAMLLLPERNRRVIVGAWLGIVVSGVLLNIFFPEQLSWVNQTFFDPIRQVPTDEYGRASLLAFYDVASLGKLMVWLPWIGFWVLFKEPSRTEGQGRIYGYLSLVLLSGVASLATNQRGPFLGILLGCLAFLAHRAMVEKNKNVLKFGGLLVVASLMLIPVIVPKELVEKRLVNLFGSGQTTAWNSSHDRLALWKFALHKIPGAPLGKGCYSLQEYADAGVIHPGHSHNLFLEQFLSRGWFWGAFHVFLWFSALIVAWRLKSVAASALVGGILTTIGLGMVDHPWFVINHAILLSMFLLGPFSVRINKLG